MKRLLYKKILFLFIIFFSLSFLLSSCKKLVNVNQPANQLTTDQVFTSDNAAISAMIGIYSKFISSSTIDYLPTLLPALSADELNNFTTTASFTTFNNNAIQPTDVYSQNLWTISYNIIYQANSLIENLDQNNAVSDAVKKQVTGEAKFMRAFFYFELTNFFGDIPMVTTTDVRKTAIEGRDTQSAIYQQIVTDLKDAQGLLTNTYAGPDRARVNKATATALLAKVYLYQQDWPNAEAQSTDVINNNTYSLVTNLSNVFIKTSTETIFQYATPNGFTDVGSTIIPSGTTPNYVFTANFVNSFEANDQRKTNWTKTITTGTTTYYYPYKYKQRTTATANQEYLIVLRLAEQYLIRAEARAQQNNISGAQADLNAIRNRAMLPNTTAFTKDDLLTAIEKERRIELFTEWGHRWFDLKRTNRANTVLGSAKTNWKPEASLYPVPMLELTANPNLTQNNGY